jgi:hypothetical protein
LRHADVGRQRRGHGRGSDHGGSCTCKINLAITILRLTGETSITAALRHHAPAQVIPATLPG